MRYALISDIHGNLEAFEAVLSAVSKERINKYLCIGDVVGYGADPREAIRLIQFLKPEALVAGNHDWGAAGRMDLEYFNDDAKTAILWTRGVLSRSELDYLASFELVYERGSFTLVHGSLEAPEEFPYIFDSGDAYVTSQISNTRLCFVGHSHVPAIFCSKGSKKMELTRSGRVKVASGKRYVINIGSIGQPRDGDPRASYAIYDTDENTVEIRRVAYYIDRAREKILQAGLPSFLANRLLEGR